MNVYKSIMQGLNEAVEYEKGEKTARSVRMTIFPPPEISATEVKEIRQSLQNRLLKFFVALDLTICQTPLPVLQDECLVCSRSIARFQRSTTSSAVNMTDTI